jgi:hypothetical protein
LVWMALHGWDGLTSFISDGCTAAVLAYVTIHFKQSFFQQSVRMLFKLVCCHGKFRDSSVCVCALQIVPMAAGLVVLLAVSLLQLLAAVLSVCCCADRKSVSPLLTRTDVGDDVDARYGTFT